MGPVALYRLADRELNEAAQYYDGKTPGLGPSFISVAEQSEAGVILAGTVRRRLLRRFPYALLYKINPGGVRILAVTLGSRQSHGIRPRLAA